MHRVLSDEPVRALVIWAPGGEAQRIARFFRDTTTSLPADHWLTEIARSQLGYVLGQLGRFDEGEPLVLESYETLDATLGRVDAVTGDEVAAVAAEFYDPARQTTVWLGPQ